MNNSDERNIMNSIGNCKAERQHECDCEANKNQKLAGSSKCCKDEAYRNTFGLNGYPLASVFSPLQTFDNIYDCENALIRGTIFMELDLPFICGGMSGGACRG